MTDEYIFNTAQAEKLLKLSEEGRLLEHFYADYAEFLELFSGGELVEGQILGGTGTFPHGLDHVPYGRIMLYQDVSAIWDGAWTATDAVLNASSSPANFRAYYF